jgi:ABC-2 type transport system permease protein
MTQTRISSHRAIALILKLKWVRIKNQILFSLFSKRFNRHDDEKRSATPSKSLSSPFRLAFFAIIVFLGSILIFNAMIVVLEEKLTKEAQSIVTKRSTGELTRRVQTLDVFRSERFLGISSFLTSFWFLGLVLLSIGYQNKDISKLDADVEWLLTMPISIPLIYFSKIIERAIFSLGWLFLTPLYVVLLWNWGYRWSLPFIAIGLTLILNFLIALLQFSIEIACRRLFTGYALSSVQATATIIGGSLFAIMGNLPLLLLNISKASLDKIEAMGDLLLYLPTGIGLGLLQAGISRSGWIYPSIHFAETGLFFVCGWRLIRWASRRGLEAVQSPSRGRRGVRFEYSRSLFSGVIAKDLLMLRRDKTLLAQVVSPILSILPIFFIPGYFGSLISDSLKWGSISFGLGMLLLTGTATSILIHEGGALWMLYTFPRPLMKIVVEKTRIWIVLALLLSFSVLGLGIVYRGKLQVSDLTAVVWLLAGLPLYGIICASLGVLGTDTQALERRKRLREDLMAIAILFGSLLAGSILLPGWWSKFFSIAMFAMLALAWWKKAKAYIDYLIDPTAAPPPRIHFADALTAAVLFILIQSLLKLVIQLTAFDSQLFNLVASFSISAVITASVILNRFRQEGIRIKSSLSFWRDRNHKKAE